MMWMMGRWGVPIAGSKSQIDTMEPIYTDDLDDLANAMPLFVGDIRFIRIDGHSGAGKTYLAKRLALKLQLPHIELDYVLKFDGRTDYGHPLARSTTIAALKRAQFRAVTDGIRLNSLININEFGPEFRIFITKDYGSRLSQGEIARRKRLGTDDYMVRYSPEQNADMVVVNTWTVR